jgi:hypothetical protein
MKSPTPTHAQVRALHHALYKTERLHHLQSRQHNIAVLMNLRPAASLPAKDVRSPAGSGPQWFVPATGAVDPAVREAADDCDAIATTLMAIHDDVAGVDFPDKLRGHVMASLKAEAASWNARASFWRSPAKPDVDAVVKRIAGHAKTAADQAKPVSRYLRTAQEVGL